jgi:hypothetical protein
VGQTRPGGLRSVVAESALVRHQLLVLNRDRKRAPNLHACPLPKLDRVQIQRGKARR